MIENVTIVDKNGNGILAEGIMYVNVKNSDISMQDPDDKKYVFYTLNEEIENGQTKIYISEAADGPNQANPILDAEWKKLKDLMISISHEDIPTNIEFIKMTGMTFYVNEPKKLAIKAPVRQALKDAYFSGIIANQQQQNVTQESTPVFFDNSVLENNNLENNVNEESSPINAFNSLPQEMVNPATSNTFETPVLTNVVDSTMQQQMVQAPTSAAQPNNVKVVVGKTAPIVINTGGANTANQEQKVLNTNTILDSNLQTIDNDISLTNDSQTKKMNDDQAIHVDDIEIEAISKVTKEEAIEALKVLNRYFGINTGEINAIEKTIDGEKEIENSIFINSNEIVENNEEEFELKLPEEIPDLSNITTNTNIGENNTNTLVEPNLLNNFDGFDITNSATNNLYETVNETPLQQTSLEKSQNNHQEVAGGFIDTSVQGLSAPINSSQQEGLSTVNFDIPAIPEIPETNSQDVMKPMSAPPTFNNELDIPMISPMQLEEPNNEYTATSNQGAAVLTSNIMPMQNMPAVTMPDNTVGVKAATMNMMEAGNLGPSGLISQEN